MSTTTTWLLASILVLAQPPHGCFGPPETGRQSGPPETGRRSGPPEIGRRSQPSGTGLQSQPPEPGEPTPEPSPPEPGEPIDPPAFEEATPEPEPGIPIPDAAAPCCYTHPRYAGTCVVTPAEDETCASILAYLNDQMSVGKTYCNSTDIRGGWEGVLCASR